MSKAMINCFFCVMGCLSFRTMRPSQAPVSRSPTYAPSAAPVVAPVASPTYAPSAAPIASPTKAPSAAPISSPTQAPSAAPIALPSAAPVALPTRAPTYAPTSSSCTTAIAITRHSAEGNIELVPGATVGTGYRVNIVSSSSGTVTVTNAVVTLYYACSKSGSPVAGTIVMSLPDQSFTGSGWQSPSGLDDPAVWQIPSQSISAATAVCGGGSIWVNSQSGGAWFSGTASGTAGLNVHFQFHYRETSPDPTSGSWSGTFKATLC
jgi:hypothetical protein